MTKKPNIVLVDDDKIDQEIIRQILSQYKIETNLTIFNNGEEFLFYIKNTKNKPDLILLDINMPKISGKEVLNSLTDCQIKNRIIIILTTSENNEDINFCYNAGVKSFITKPSDLVTYYSIIENILNYWFEKMLKLPNFV